MSSRFPDNEHRHRQLVLAVRRERLNTSKYCRIISKHYRDSDFDRDGQATRLKATAVLSVFNAYAKHLTKVSGQISV